MGYAAAAVLLIIVIILALRLYAVKKSAREITDSITEKLHSDTNTLICISSSDKDMSELASRLNTELKYLREQYSIYTSGNAELKAAVTNISHDLRTPLTAICGYLDIMKDIEKSDQLEKYLKIIDERAESMKQLTEELFRYSVIISQDETEKEDVFVNQLLEESIGSFYPVLTEKGIIPEINICPERVVKKLNRASMQRVFSNLISNAAKYSDGDLFITLKSSGEIIFANSSEKLSYIEAERLFDRFYTVETARNSTGLGLSIAKKLLNDMNCSISAAHRNGMLCITITLPE